MASNSPPPRISASACAFRRLGRQRDVVLLDDPKPHAVALQFRLLSSHGEHAEWAERRHEPLGPPLQYAHHPRRRSFRRRGRSTPHLGAARQAQLLRARQRERGAAGGLFPPGSAKLEPARRLASRARTHRPSACLRKTDNVWPDRRCGCPPGGVIVTVTRLRIHAQSSASSSSSISELLSIRVPCRDREVFLNSSLPNGARPDTRKRASSAISPRTASTSPAAVA